MAFITPDENCGCCPTCGAFDCKDGVLDSSRTVDSIVITIADVPAVATSIHHAFRFNGFNSMYEWIELTDISSIFGNYTLARTEEGQCFGNSATYTNFSVLGNLYKTSTVDGQGCPSGIIETQMFTHAVNSLLVSWDNILGFTVTFNTNASAFGTQGFFGSQHAYGFSWVLPRSAVQCAGGTLGVSIPGRVDGDFGFCAGYPANVGASASYAFTP